MNAIDCTAEVSESKELIKKTNEERPEFHPLALVFPEMRGEEFTNLVASIKECGQRVPVLLAGGKIADGRNRARAVWKLQDEGFDMELQTEVWDQNMERSLADEVWSRNAVRRQLTPDQLAMSAVMFGDWVAAECRERQAASRFGAVVAGKPLADPNPDSPAGAALKGDKNARSQRGQLAAMAGVKRNKIDRAIRVARSGPPNLLDAVARGSITLANACRQLPSKDAGRAETAKKVVKETPSIEELARRAWAKLKDEVGCADAAALRVAMRKVIKDDEDACVGGTKTLPVGGEKRGRGRPPKPR